MKDHNQQINETISLDKYGKEAENLYNCDVPESTTVHLPKKSKSDESPSKKSRISKNLDLKFERMTSFSNETSATDERISPLSSNDFETLVSTKNIKVSILIAKEPGKDKKISEELYSIDLTISSWMFNRCIIKQCLDSFNDLFEIKNELFRLSLDHKNYKLRPSKKSGKPNFDYPCIDLDSSLKDTGLVSFSLMYLEDDLIIMKKKTKCTGCSIF